MKKISILFIPLQISDLVEHFLLIPTNTLREGIYISLKTVMNFIVANRYF